MWPTVVIIYLLSITNRTILGRGASTVFITQKKSRNDKIAREKHIQAHLIREIQIETK